MRFTVRGYELINAGKRIKGAASYINAAWHRDSHCSRQIADFDFGDVAHENDSPDSVHTNTTAFSTESRMGV